MIWNANPTAQPAERTSPKFIPCSAPPLGMVIRYNPTNAQITPNKVQWLMRLRQKSARKTGTSTTETPVRNADFDGVVRRKPVVWNWYPRKRNDPTTKPEMIARRVMPCNFLRKITKNAIAARVILIALNSSGVISANAFLMTTNVAPQTSVTRTSNKCAFSERFNLIVALATKAGETPALL